MFIIVGLGNPGEEYKLTRHNIGFMVVDALSAANRMSFKEASNKYLLAKGRVAGKETAIIKPKTYMNLSGEALKELLGTLKRTPESIVVIYDDIYLPLGKIRIRERGGAGGHNGVASIIEHLGTEDFIRIRMGVGELEAIEATDGGAKKEPAGEPIQGFKRSESLSDFVLSPFEDSELEALEDVVGRVADAVEALLARGVKYAMNNFNRLKTD